MRRKSRLLRRATRLGNLMRLHSFPLIARPTGIMRLVGSLPGATAARTMLLNLSAPLPHGRKVNENDKRQEREEGNRDRVASRKIICRETRKERTMTARCSPCKLAHERCRTASSGLIDADFIDTRLFRLRHFRSRPFRIFTFALKAVRCGRSSTRDTSLSPDRLTGASRRDGQVPPA